MKKIQTKSLQTTHYKLQTNKGFTVIELLMVFAILSVIASIILLVVGDTRTKSRDAKWSRTLL